MSYHITVHPDRAIIDIAGPHKTVLRFNELDKNPMTEERITEALENLRAAPQVMKVVAEISAMCTWANTVLDSVDPAVEAHVRMDGLMDPEFWGAVELTLGAEGSETILDVHGDQDGTMQFCVTSWDSSLHQDVEEVVEITADQTLEAAMTASGHEQHLALSKGLDELWPLCHRAALSTS